MDGELARHLLVDVVPDSFGKVLHEVAATGDVQELEAAADRERRHVTLERRLQERQLTRVPTGLRRIGLRVGVGPVARGIDVGAAREDDPVERVERLLDVLLGRRNDERTPSGLLDRVDVCERDERGGQMPHAPARVLRVRGDPDDRPHAASVSTIQSVPSAHSLARPSACSRLTRRTRTVSPSSLVRAPSGEAGEWNRQARTWRAISAAGFAQSIHAYSGSKNGSRWRPLPSADRRDRRAPLARGRVGRSREGVRSGVRDRPSPARRPAGSVPGRGCCRCRVRVHVVEGEADLRFPIPDCPRHRARPAVPGEQRRMTVDDAMRGHREGIGWDLPRKARAECEIRLERAKKRHRATENSTGRDHHLLDRGPYVHCRTSVRLCQLGNAFRCRRGLLWDEVQAPRTAPITREKFPW